MPYNVTFNITDSNSNVLGCAALLDEFTTAEFGTGTLTGVAAENNVLRFPSPQVFISSGAYTVPLGVTSVAVLVVAGGGGGGTNRGGGGGGGGVIYNASYPVTPGATIPVTVGAGGAGGGGGARGMGTNGGDSVFGTLTAKGGGGGSGETGVPGKDGGSGGGGDHAGPSAGGAGEVGQGYIGGAGSSTLSTSGGGGGGAGGAGQDANTSVAKGGDGGPGVEVFGNYYGGGGGGGAYPNNAAIGLGGIGGGGNGAVDSVSGPVPGAANTGGGGGGGTNSSFPGAAGGSGIVIVRAADTLSGSRVSTALDLNSYGTSAPDLKIKWDATVPAGTTLTVETGISDSNSTPPSTWHQQTNGSSVANLPADLTGKYLYYKASLATTDDAITPELEWVVVYDGADAPTAAARVEFNGETKTVSPAGAVVFTSVDAGTDLPYTVYALALDGADIYENIWPDGFADTVTIVDADVTENVSIVIPNAVVTQQYIEVACYPTVPPDAVVTQQYIEVAYLDAVLTPVSIEIGSSGLLITGSAVVVSITEHQTVSIGSCSLVLTGSTVSIPSANAISIGTSSLIITGNAITVSQTNHQTCSISSASLTITGAAVTPVDEAAPTSAVLDMSGWTVDAVPPVTLGDNLWTGTFANEYPNASTGVFTASATAETTLYVPVTEGKTYCFSGGDRCRVLWYTDADVFISGSDETNTGTARYVTAPIGAASVRYYYTSGNNQTGVSIQEVLSGLVPVWTRHYTTYLIKQPDSDKLIETSVNVFDYRRSLVWVNEIVSNDIEITASHLTSNVFSSDSEGKINMGVVLRGSSGIDKETGYICAVKHSSIGGRVELGKFVNGSYTLLAADTFDYGANDVVHVKFKAVGSNLYGKAWLGDLILDEPTAWMLTGVDSALTLGAVGLYFWDGNASDHVYRTSYLAVELADNNVSVAVGYKGITLTGGSVTPYAVKSVAVGSSELQIAGATVGVSVTDHQFVSVNPGQLIIDGSTVTADATANQAVVITPSDVLITGGGLVVSTSDRVDVAVGDASISVIGGAVALHTRCEIGAAELTVAGRSVFPKLFVPIHHAQFFLLSGSVAASVGCPVPAGQLVIEGAALTVHLTDHQVADIGNSTVTLTGSAVELYTNVPVGDSLLLLHPASVGVTTSVELGATSLVLVGAALTVEYTADVWIAIGDGTLILTGGKLIGKIGELLQGAITTAVFVKISDVYTTQGVETISAVKVSDNYGVKYAT